MVTEDQGLVPCTQKSSKLAITSYRGSNPFVWPLQALYTYGVQTYMQAKHPYTWEKKFPRDVPKVNFGLNF